MKEYCRDLFPFILIACLIVVLIGHNTSVAEKKELDIDKLVHAVHKQRGSIIEWSLYTRELPEKPSQEWTVTRMKSIFPEWDWSLASTKEGKTVIGINRHGNMEEHIKAVTADNREEMISYISYEIKGTSWDRSISERAEKLLQSRTQTIFMQTPVIFSCIKGVFNDGDKFEQSLVNRFMSSLLAKEKEALREEGFISISAYSSLFDQSLSLHKEEMNLQIGLRKNKAGQGTYFTVGTPILTNEY